MNFVFNAEFTREPVALSGEVPYVAPQARSRMFESLAAGCYCRHEAPRAASLTRRLGAVWLQCDACGSALGSAMSKAHHPKYDTYPPWRAHLKEAYAQAHSDYREALPGPQDIARQREAEYRARRIDYDIWCRTAPEWAAMRKLVAWRSRGHCEACLGAPAEIVHHLTYALGRLPPAWELRAVCRPCHKRLHDNDDDWCGYGMGRDNGG